MTSPRPDTLNQSTLVQRLRDASSALLGHYPVGAIERIPADTMTEAADTIESLCEALREAADGLERAGQNYTATNARVALAKATA